MTKLLLAMGEIHERYIDEYENYRPERRSFTKYSGACIAAMLAVFILVGGFAMWLRLPAGVSEAQIQRMTYLVIDGWIAEYQVLDDADMTNYEALTLRRGALYTERNGAAYYFLHGRDTLYRLVMVDEAGEERLVEFRNLRDRLSAEQDMTKTMWYDWGFLTDEDIPTLRREETYTFGYMLETICGVTSADDIKQVRFEKTETGSFDWERRVKVHTVTLRDEAALTWLYGILAGMVRAPWDAEQADAVGIRDAAYLAGEMPLALQTERRVTITLKDGTELALSYLPAAMQFDGWETINEPDNAWLIRTAEIDMAWRDWGTMEPERDNAAVSVTAGAKEEE